MEAFNISEDKLDLDSDDMSNKKNLKPSPKDDKVDSIIAEIKLKVNALIANGVAVADISKAIKEVYTDGGKPSSNYVECKDPAVAKNILKFLENKFGGGA